MQEEPRIFTNEERFHPDTELGKLVREMDALVLRCATLENARMDMLKDCAKYKQDTNTVAGRKKSGLQLLLSYDTWVNSIAADELGLVPDEDVKRARRLRARKAALSR